MGVTLFADSLTFFAGIDFYGFRIRSNIPYVVRTCFPVQEVRVAHKFYSVATSFLCLGVKTDYPVAFQTGGSPS
jgi:hypothetical protein